ncbi:MAG: FGGY family carbohydrate kinase [Microbacterium sp.]
MSAGYVIGVDAGQTAVKAVVFDEQMQIRGISRRDSPLDMSTPRHVERSQDALWSTAADAIAGAVADANVSPDAIGAVAIAGHGDGMHLVDAGGRPVSAAVTAMDTRAHGIRDDLLAQPDRMRTILQISGQSPAAGAPGMLLAWFLKNDRATLDRAAYLLSCKDVLVSRLTGQIGTDYSDACASFLDTASATWSPEVMAAYGLDGWEHLNPPVRGGGEVAGTVTAAAAERAGLTAGTPVLVGVHDVQAASIGMAALVEDRLALVAGSFSTNGVTTRRADVDPRWQSRLSITPDLRIAMASSPTASPSLNWMLALLGADSPGERDALFAEVAALPATDPTPLVLPYLLSSPLGPSASGTVLGLRQWQSRAHLLKGMLEGIALVHHEHTRILATKFPWTSPIALSGGISRSPVYARMVAGVMHEPVVPVRNEEAGALVVAALAWVALGRFPDIVAAQELVPQSETLEPDPETAGYWAQRRTEFESANERLEPWWSEFSAREEAEDA